MQLRIDLMLEVGMEGEPTVEIASEVLGTNLESLYFLNNCKVLLIRTALHSLDSGSDIVFNFLTQILNAFFLLNIFSVLVPHKSSGLLYLML